MSYKRSQVGNPYMFHENNKSPRNKTNHYLSNRKRETSASLSRSFICPSCLHHSHAAPMLTRVCLRSLSRDFFAAAISASGCLFLAFLAGELLQEGWLHFLCHCNQMNIFSCNSLFLEECAEYFRHQRNLTCARAEEGGTEDETWRHLTNQSI